MPLVVRNMPAGIAGLFMAVLLAALMSTLSAIINVTSNVVLNDFLKRYFARNMSEPSLVRLGMVASSGVILVGFGMSFMYEQIISAWELLLYVMLTMIMVPAALRWHWWRFGARAFLWSMVASTGVVVIHKVFLNDLPLHWAIVFLMLASLAVTVIITLLTKPADMETLVPFYAKIRPFGVWGPVRREAVRRGLVPEKDPMPTHGRGQRRRGLVLPALPRDHPAVHVPEGVVQHDTLARPVAATLGVLYFTWYRYLPSPDER